MVTYINENTYEFRGLSTDHKPITQGFVHGEASGELVYEEIQAVISNGSVFFEMDTQSAYMFKTEEVEVEGKKKLKGSWIKIA